MRATAITFFCIVLATSLGCRTRPIPEPAEISLPPSISTQQAIVAIIAGILNTPPPAGYDPSVELTDREFDAMIWNGFVAQARGKSWFPESRSKNTIYAAVDTRGLFLRVRIDRGPEVIRISVVNSRNLDQSDTRIHKQAIKWLRNLEAHIRREIGRMAVFSANAA